MGLHREIDLLKEQVAEAAKKALSRLDPADYYINETLRDQDVQAAYFSRGRKPVEEVQLLYKAAGLYDISEKEAASGPITWTMKSNHLTGEALDIYPRSPSGSILYGANKEAWNKIATVFKNEGFSWGGDWYPADLPHFEMKIL